MHQTLGSYPELSLAEARRRTPEVLRTLATGRTPKMVEDERLAEEEARRRAEEARDRDRFAAVAEDFIAEHLPRLRHARAGEAMIRKSVDPRIGTPRGILWCSEITFLFGTRSA